MSESVNGDKTSVRLGDGSTVSFPRHRHSPDTRTPILDGINYNFKNSRVDTAEIWWTSRHDTSPPLSRIFVGTQYEVNIPGPENKTVAEEELGELREETFLQEPQNLFFRHLVMLGHYGSADDLNRLVPIMLKRKTTFQTDQFLADAYENTDDRNNWRATINREFKQCLKRAIKSDSFFLDPTSATNLYEFARNSDPSLIGYAIKLDERNKQQGTSQHLDTRFKTEFVQDLLSQEEKNNTGKLESQLHWAGIAMPTLPLDILRYALLKANSQAQIESIARIIAQEVGLEKIRVDLREYAKSNPAFESKLEAVFAYLGIDQGSDFSMDLGEDVYENMDLSEYKPNLELLEFESDLLMGEFSDTDRVLDVGCGTGRLLEALGDKGVSVSGVDIVPKHIDHIKGKNPEADVQIGSWYSLPYPDKAFKGGYCLGRSLTHNLTIPDMVACLTELKRVVDGPIIIDLPDANAGEYPELIERTLRISRDRGITNVIPGLINDSPDLVHYFDRFVPDDRQFMALAAMAGFSAKVIAERKYEGTNKAENVNKYWLLKSDDNAGRVVSGHPEEFWQEIFRSEVLKKPFSEVL